MSDLTRCPVCGYNPGAIPSPFHAFEQAWCPEQDRHEMLDEIAGLRREIERLRGYLDDACECARCCECCGAVEDCRIRAAKIRKAEKKRGEQA